VPAAKRKLYGDVPVTFGSSITQILLAPSLLLAASSEDCKQLKAETRKELETVFDAAGTDLLLLVADEQEHRHFSEEEEGAWRQLGCRQASCRRAVDALLSQMPCPSEDAAETAAWDAREGPRLLKAAQMELQESTERRNLSREYHLLGHLHVVKNGIISFYKAHRNVGMEDILLCFTEPKQVEKMITCAHGYIKFNEEQLLNLILSFLQQTDAFITREAARLRALTAPAPLDSERLALYGSHTVPLREKMASLARDNVNFQLLHDALLIDALSLIAFRRAGELHASDPENPAGA